jgi:uncharacterized protein (TIGR02246 family)
MMNKLLDEDVTAIKQMIADQEPLLLAGDLEGLSQLFTEDVVLMPPNAPAAKGREAILQMFAGTTFTKFSSSLVEIEGSDDFAFGRGTMSWTFSVEGTTESITDSGKWAASWKKQPDGRWLVAIDIWNSDNPII